MGVFRRLLGISTTATATEGWRVDGSAIVVELDRVPALKSPGGAARLEGSGLEPRLLVLHGVDGVFRAFKNNCACSGWRIDPVAGEEKVRCCTLAASTYDYDGKRLAGPAAKDLETFPVEREGDRLTIRLR